MTSKRLAALLTAAFVLTGCTHSFPVEHIQSEEAAPVSGPASEDWFEGRRYATYPIVENSVEKLPFAIWAPPETVDVPVTLIDADASDEPVFLEQTQATEAPSALHPLALMGPDRFLAEDQTGDANRVGSVDSAGIFSPFEIVDADYLPGGVEYWNYDAIFGAVSNTPSGQELALWAGVDDDSWSLLLWSQEQEVLTELASSSSMTLGFSGISAELDRAVPVTTNGRTAYFTVLLPKALVEEAWVGGRLHEFMAIDTGEGLARASFAVDFDAPGDAIYLGGVTQAVGDSLFTNGHFTALSSPDIREGEQTQSGELQGLEQSGEGFTGGQLDGCALVEPPCSQPLTTVAWVDEEGIEPVFLLPADVEVVSLAASERFLSTLVTADGTNFILIWNLEEIRFEAILETPEVDHLGADAQTVFFGKTNQLGVVWQAFDEQTHWQPLRLGKEAPAQIFAWQSTVAGVWSQKTTASWVTYTPSN